MEVPTPPPTLLEVVSSLVTAWRNLAAYPASHPARAGALTTAHARIHAYLAVVSPLTLGIGREGLVSSGKKLEAAQVRAFARALYRRNGALLRFEDGLEPRELESFLGLLGDTGPTRDQPLTVEALRAAGIRHVTLSAIDYAALVTTTDVSEPSGENSLWEGLLQALLEDLPLDARGDLTQPRERYSAETIASLFRGAPAPLGTGGGPSPGGASALGAGPGGAGGGFGSSAAGGTGGGGTGAGAGRGDDSGGGWGSASGARGSGSGSGGGGGAGGTGTGSGVHTATGHGIGAGAGGTGGGLGLGAAHTLGREVAARLAAADSDERGRLNPQVIQLIRTLPAEVREPVLAAALRVLATDDASSAHLAALAAALPAADVLRGLQRLAREHGQLSAHALSMVQALAETHEAVSDTSFLPEPPADLAEMATLFREEDVDRYNPEDHRALLAQKPTIDLAAIAVELAADPDAFGPDTESDEAIERRLIITVLDMMATSPDVVRPLVLGRLRDIFTLALRVNRFAQAIGIIRAVRELAADPAQAERREALEEFVATLADAELLASLVAASRQPGGPPFVQVQSLVLALGASASRGLLEALAAEPERARRLRLIELAASLGPAIVPETRRLLSDPRWYVVRNMVLLLRRVQDRSAMDEIRRCADHSDLRVRLEAIRALFAFDSKVPHDLLARTIHHPDPRLAEAAVLLTGQHGITQATDLLVEILRRWDVLGRRRSIRLKALRALADLGDPAVLPRIAHVFREWPFPIVALEERRAAYRLLGSYDEAARAAYVARGQRSRDAMIREICQGLRKSGTA